MATRTASAAKSTAVIKSLRVGTWAVTSTFSIPASQSISIGDVIQMIAVPDGAMVVGLHVRSDYFQATLTVGDGLDDDRYIAHLSTSAAFAATYGAGGLGAVVVAPYTYSTDDTIDLFISLVSVTSILGAFYMTAILTMDPTQYN